jgi:hypothetical protein
MLRIEFYSSDCEWNFIKTEAQRNGYNNEGDFIINRIRKVAVALPETEVNGFVCEKKLRSFRIYDEVFIRKLTAYCFSQKIHPSTLMRRLVVDPVVRKHLLGEVLA